MMTSNALLHPPPHTPAPSAAPTAPYSSTKMEWDIPVNTELAGRIAQTGSEGTCILFSDTKVPHPWSFIISAL